MKNAIAYERVSTAGQGRSGLGLKAQRATIARLAAQEGFRIVESFAETETGKGADALARRPKLAAALKAARRIDNGCPVTSQSLIACRRDREGGVQASGHQGTRHRALRTHPCARGR
jgi:DNA invertase Pin-like site-specific DNA recombinase